MKKVKQVQVVEGTHLRRINSIRVDRCDEKKGLSSPRGGDTLTGDGLWFASLSVRGLRAWRASKGDESACGNV